MIIGVAIGVAIHVAIYHDMDGDANSDTNNYLFAADGATRRRPQVINPRLFLPGRPRGEVPVTAGHQFVRAAGAGAISLKSFFQKDFKETAMWRMIYIYIYIWIYLGVHLATLGDTW